LLWYINSYQLECHSCRLFSWFLSFLAIVWASC
jgi:hypothetical protein